jgi:betaine-homocysteine S-methyltransferase
MKKNVLEKRLEKGPLLIAEGYVFELEKRGYIKAGPFVPEVVLDFPSAVEELSREYMRAGSDVVLALTYYANRNKLADVGRENDLEKLNRKAVRIARKVAKEGGALVAGNICNTWMYKPNDKKSEQTVRAIYEEQVQWAVDEGVDFFISETNDFLGEALIGLDVIKKAGLPAIVNFATVQPDKTVDGYDYAEACRIVKEAGADVVGLNCTRGSKTILPILKKIRKIVDGPIAALPVPYNTDKTYPTFQSFKKKGEKLNYLNIEKYMQTRYEIAEFAVQAKDAGVDVIGLCCGAAPYHFRSLAEALGRKTDASKYSPAWELHPMLGKSTKGKEKSAVKAWKD